MSGFVQQWIKSVDDRGYTYYYLRDGSRSLWNLPEVNSFVDIKKREEKGRRHSAIKRACSGE